MAAHRHYLYWLFATVTGASLLVAGLVLLVDPYGLYALADIPGFNRVKPPVERYRNEVRLARAERFAPRLLILGNSRMEAGIDPDGPQLAGTNAFNLGLAGTSMVLAVEQLRHLGAQAVRPERVIAGVEFVDVLTPTPVPGADLGQPLAQPLAPPPPLPVRAAHWRDQLWRADTLYSFASLKDALVTVAIQHDPAAAMATLRGHNPLRQYHQAAGIEGYAALFSQRAADNTRKLAGYAAGGLDAGAVRAQLAALIDAAVATNPAVAVDLVIYPYHAQLLALFEEANLWPRFEAWKELVVAEAAAGRARHRHARIAVHDFSGYGPVQCEAIPAPGSTETTRWYWEAGHFKPALGDAIVARVLGKPAAGVPADFGVPLDAARLPANRARIAAERRQCVARHGAMFAEVARAVARERDRLGPPRALAAR